MPEQESASSHQNYLLLNNGSIVKPAGFRKSAELLFGLPQRVFSWATMPGQCDEPEDRSHKIQQAGSGTYMLPRRRCWGVWCLYAPQFPESHLEFCPLLVSLALNSKDTGSGFLAHSPHQTPAEVLSLFAKTEILLSACRSAMWTRLVYIFVWFNTEIWITGRNKKGEHYAQDTCEMLNYLKCSWVC